MTAGCIRRRARLALGFVACAVIALTMSAARADDPARPWLAHPPEAAPAPAPAAEPARFPWRASLMIGVSAALGGAAVWVRSRRGGLAKLTSSRELRVISSVRVGPKGHLVLAGIGDRALLLGVTDSSVRRIAWLPAEQLAGSAASLVNLVGTADGASAAMVPGIAVDAHPMHRSGFADILRRLGGRSVDAPPGAGNEASAASTLAELRRDDVSWSRDATSAATSAPARVAPRKNMSEAAGPELEQQAAGILKHRSRRRG
jgi:flagellar biogenesis protein FliO